MNKLFISNLALVIMLNLLVKPFYIFGIDRGVQNAVGAAEYGLYFAIFNFTYLFQIINDFGLQNYNHSVLSKNPQLIPSYLPRILSLKLLLALLFIALTLITSSLIGFTRFLWPLVILIVLNQVFLSFLLYLRTTLSALGHYRLDSVLSVSDKLLMIGGMGYLLWYSSNQVSVSQFVIAQTLSLFLSLLLAFIFLTYHQKPLRIQWQFNAGFSVNLIKKSMPYALVLLLMTLYTRMDAVMLERLLIDGQQEAGIYAASYRILDAFSNLGLLFAGLLLPMFAKLIRSGQTLYQLINTSRNLLVVLSIVIISISLVYHDQIIFMLYPQATSYWSSVFQILFVSYFGISIGYIYGTLLTANESIMPMNLIFLTGVGLNFTLNLILIPARGAMGAALATAVTQLLVALALVVLAYRQLQLPLDPGKWSKILLLGLLVYFITDWTQSWPLHWLFASFLTGVIAVMLALILRLINFRDWIPLRL